MQEDIRKACVFLREKNNTIPSEVIEFMKQASLKAWAELERKSNIVLISHRGQEPVEYAHVIAPIKEGDTFLPNKEALRDIRANSIIYIENHVFERSQTAGKTIIVNEAGGWCYLTEDSKIIE